MNASQIWRGPRLMLLAIGSPLRWTRSHSSESCIAQSVHDPRLCGPLMIFVWPNRHAADHQQLPTADDGGGQRFVEIVVAVNTQPETQAAEATSVAEGARIELDVLCSTES